MPLLMATFLASLMSARAQSEPRYDVALANVMVPMRDGVKLATDIYRPARNGAAVEGKFPALLERTPYGKGGGSAAAAIAPYFVSRGYVVVVQDVRGRYQSEGHWRPIADDPNDGFDTAAWIGAQSWSDGGIGTIGTSYGGATQHALAIANAPHVKAMIPRNAMSDFGRYGVRHNGAFELRLFNWVFTMGNTTPGTPNAAAAAARAASTRSPRRPCSIWAPTSATMCAAFRCGPERHR